ncbi:MAG: TIGR01458 family HAD-type hydrolase [Gammaproteobacteria bacterium]|nr:TIGR01458 family HAD-type hydrolase [Gammaproteobacteria bacterium]
MKALLIDLDGVLYEGERVVEGAATTVNWLRSEKIPFLFVTNTTSRPRSALVTKLSAFGIEIGENEIFTPPMAARAWLLSSGAAPVALFVPEETRADFADVPLWDESSNINAGAVILGDLSDAWDFDRLNQAFRLLMAESSTTLVALGLTRYWKTTDGLQLDVGPFVKALEYASGRTAVVMGKPSPDFFGAALHELGCPADQVGMVGDDIIGDIGGAQRAGIRGIQVRTGKFRADDLKGAVKPDAILASIAALPAWWAQQPD